VSEDEQENEKVEEAAAHAASSVEHRRQVQRQAVKAQAADGADESRLERDAAQHGAAAEREEDAAQDAAHEADSGA
jgi:hypothetical protein